MSRRRLLHPVVGAGLTAARAVTARRLPGMIRRARASALMLQHRLVTPRRGRPRPRGRSAGSRLDGRHAGRSRPRPGRRGGRRHHERPAPLRRACRSITVRSPDSTWPVATLTADAPPAARDRFCLHCRAFRGPGRSGVRRRDHTASDDDPPPPTTTEPLPPPGPKLIEPGVTIGGLLVGGLTAPEARALVEERFRRPVTLVVSSGRKLRVDPSELGAAAHFLKAVKTAVRVRTPGFAVPLRVDVKQSKLAALPRRHRGQDRP